MDRPTMRRSKSVSVTCNSSRGKEHRCPFPCRRRHRRDRSSRQPCHRDRRPLRMRLGPLFRINPYRHLVHRLPRHRVPCRLEKFLETSYERSAHRYDPDATTKETNRRRTKSKKKYVEQLSERNHCRQSCPVGIHNPMKETGFDAIQARVPDLQCQLLVRAANIGKTRLGCDAK